jgi:hypothetical protein
MAAEPIRENASAITEPGVPTMKPHHLACVLVLSGLLAMSSAGAADVPDKKPGGNIAEACAQDAKTLCPDVKPGDGRIAACFKENRRKLSAGCKDAIKEQRANKKAGEK